MTPAEAVKAVYDEFEAEWDTDRAMVLREGESRAEPPTGTPYVRLAFRDLGGGQHTMGDAGARIYRRDCAVQVQVFVPAGRGMHTSATLAHAARAIFEGRRVGGVDFFDGTVAQLPLRLQEKWLQTNVEVRGTYDETK